MKNTITRVDALNFAIDTINTYRVNDTAVCEVLTKIRDGIVKANTRKTSDEVKAKQSEKRKAATATARAELITKVAPVLREGLQTCPLDSPLDPFQMLQLLPVHHLIR